MKVKNSTFTRKQLREIEKSIFPIECIGRKLNSPDDINDEYIDYCIGTWCCNSLNAVGGRFKYLNPSSETNYIITSDGVKHPLISYKECQSVSVLFDRAQSVINYLRVKIEILEKELSEEKNNV